MCGYYIKNEGETSEPYSDKALSQFLKFRNLKSEDETFDGHKVHKVIVLEKDMGHSRYEKIIIDIDAGEVLAKVHGTNRAELFPDKCNAIIRELLVSRDVLPNRVEKIYVSTIDGITYFTKVMTDEEKRFGERKGTGKGRGRTKGKPKNFVMPEKTVTEIQKKLDDNTLGFLFRLAGYARWDTGMLARRGKPLKRDDLCKLLKVSSGALSNKLNMLIKAGVIKKDGAGFVLDKNFIRKE